MKRLGLVLLLVAGLATPAMASPVTVVNNGTTPGLTVNVVLPGVYTGGVYAGVENLLVDGVSFKGFCIDLSHLAVSSALYNIVPLSDSPTAPGGPMGDDKADFIREIWAQYYVGALASNSAAASFQLAIWGVLKGSVAGGMATPDFAWLTSGDKTGALAIIEWANGATGALAYDVVGLNSVTGGAQGYAIQGVPDGGATLMLLGGALVGLGALRRKFRG